MNRAKKLRILALGKLLKQPHADDYEDFFRVVPIDGQLCRIHWDGPAYVAFYNRGTRKGWERVETRHLTIAQLDIMLDSLHPGFDLEMWLLQQELSE